MKCNCPSTHYHDFDCQLKQVNAEVHIALTALVKAFERVNQLWDHTGSNMIAGYPKWMPSFDEALSDIQHWAEEVKKEQRR